MRRTSAMKMVYGSLIGIVLVMMVVPLAGATDRAFPSWDKQINNSGRFKVLGDFAGSAVLDKETGLVWEQFPDAVTRNWVDALMHCYQRTVGGRNGWRLPTVEELASLLDPNNPGGNPDLPPGHPFDNVRSSPYWTATIVADGTGTTAWRVRFNDGDVQTDTKSILNYVWCVRGGQGIDGVQ